MRVIYLLPQDWPDARAVARLAGLIPGIELIPLEEVSRSGLGRLQADLLILFTHALGSDDYLVANLLRPTPVQFVFRSIATTPADNELPLDGQFGFIRYSEDELFDEQLRLHLELAQRQMSHTGVHLSTLLDNLKTAILFENPARRIEHVNDRFCELFDIPLSKDALMGADCSQLAHQSKSVFAEPDSFIQLTEAAIRERRSFRNQPFEMADGRQLLRHYTPIVSEGVLLGHLWQYQDVSWQKRIESELRRTNADLERTHTDLERQNSLLAQEQEKLKIILSSADTIFCVLDNQGVIQLAQGKGLEKLGLDPARYVGVSAYYYERYAPQLMGAVDRCLRGEAFSEEVSLGRYVFLYTFSPLFDAEGRLELVVIFGADITERKEAERALIRARELAESAVEAKERFLASMSHEIRNPLNGVVGLANLLMQTELTPLQAEYVHALRHSTDSLMGILNDVLDLSKIRAGKLDLERIPFSMRGLLANLRRTQGIRAQEKRLSFDVQVGAEVPAVLLGDPIRLNQILSNLVSNALKFTEQGGLKLDVAVVEETTKRVTLQIAVSDTGIGIAADRLSHIFDSFTQASSETSRRYGGTGLGLSIVRELAHLLGGTVEVRSELDQGSTFTVRLGYDRAPEGALPASPTFFNPVDEWIGPYRVLLVEDYPVNQLITERILRGWGVQVAVAENGRIALECMEREPFDLVLMDLRMPEMDGYEATERIRQLPEPRGKVPIIAITAQALREEKERCLQLGMNDYVAKPFDARRLYQAIVSFLTPRERTLAKTRVAPEILSIGEAGSASHSAAHRQRYNLDYLTRFFDGDTRMVIDIVTLSISEIGKDLELLRESLAAGDADTIKLVAHRMKTNLAQLGDKPTAQLLEAIEHEVKRHQRLPSSEQLAHASAEVEALLTSLQVDLEGGRLEMGEPVAGN